MCTCFDATTIWGEARGNGVDKRREDATSILFQQNETTGENTRSILSYIHIYYICTRTIFKFPRVFVFVQKKTLVSRSSREDKTQFFLCYLAVNVDRVPQYIYIYRSRTRIRIVLYIMLQLCLYVHKVFTQQWI